MQEVKEFHTEVSVKVMCIKFDAESNLIWLICGKSANEWKTMKIWYCSKLFHMEQILEVLK